MIKAYKVQLIPTKEQEELLFQCAGTARWAYNWTLNKQQENHKNGGKFIPDGTLRKEFTQLKKVDKFLWLNNYSNNITKQAIKDACNSYIRFFKGLAEFPNFKSKNKSKPSFYQDNEKIKVKDQKVKIEKLGWIDLAEDRIPVGFKYMNPRITHDGLNWWISVGVDVEIKTSNRKPTKPIGIDLGIKDLAIVSNGKKYKNINKTKKIKKLKKRLKRQQRKASKFYEKLKRKEIVAKSKNLMKLERQINKTYKSMTNVRTNHIHQMTSQLVKTKPEYIVIEDLNISGMMKNKHLSRAIQEQKLHEVVRQLEYKCEWYGIKLIKADRFYPSSKLCSCCGKKKADLKLSDRIYKCECGLVIDRDLNAAINLMNYGKSIA